MKLRYFFYWLIACFAINPVYINAQQLNNGKKAYRYYKSITVDGRQRNYLINLPPNYYDSNRFSLVIAMHGGGGNPYQFEKTSLLTEKANAAHFIVVYPEGIRNRILNFHTWNAGTCCAYAVEQNVNDVKFISRLIDTLLNDYKINDRKVYATGHSNGGMMAYRLACELSNKIAAIAPNSCTMVVTKPCNPSRPLAILHMHSVNDRNVPYKGGVVLNTHTPAPPVDSVLRVWGKIDGCATEPVTEKRDRYTFIKGANCNKNAAIEFYLTKDGGHAWPDGLPGSRMGDPPSKVINANDLLWSFFQRFELPALSKPIASAK